MQKNTVTTLWSINLIKNLTALAATTPHNMLSQLLPVCSGTNHTVTTRGIWVISASGSNVNH